MCRVLQSLFVIVILYHTFRHDAIRDGPILMVGSARDSRAHSSSRCARMLPWCDETTNIHERFCGIPTCHDASLRRTTQHDSEAIAIDINRFRLTLPIYTICFNPLSTLNAYCKTSMDGPRGSDGTESEVTDFVLLVFFLSLMTCWLISAVYWCRTRRVPSLRIPASFSRWHDDPGTHSRNCFLAKTMVVRRWGNQGNLSVSHGTLNNASTASAMMPQDAASGDQVVGSPDCVLSPEKNPPCAQPNAQGNGECAICLRQFRPGQLVCESCNAKCHHVYHNRCMRHWLLKSDVCPMCRQPYLVPDHTEQSPSPFIVGAVLAA